MHHVAAVGWPGCIHLAFFISFTSPSSSSLPFHLPYEPVSHLSPFPPSYLPSFLYLFILPFFTFLFTLRIRLSFLSSSSFTYIIVPTTFLHLAFTLPPIYLHSSALHPPVTTSLPLQSPPLSTLPPLSASSPSPSHGPHSRQCFPSLLLPFPSNPPFP